MSAHDNLSPHQFASTHDLVYKYDKIDAQGSPMAGLHPDAGPHSRGRDWGDLVETKMEGAPGHAVDMMHSVGRQGVQQPIGIDRSTNPPTVSDGHTRLMAAWAMGHKRVPVRDQPIGNAENREAERSHPGDDTAWDRIPRSARGV